MHNYVCTCTLSGGYGSRTSTKLSSYHLVNWRERERERERGGEGGCLLASVTANHPPTYMYMHVVHVDYLSLALGCKLLHQSLPTCSVFSCRLLLLVAGGHINIHVAVLSINTHTHTHTRNRRMRACGT